MDIVFYWNKSKDVCPARKYLEENIEDCDSLSDEEKNDILVDIDNKLQHAKRNKGQPCGNFLKSVRGYSFLELKSRKDESILIRLLYFSHNDKLVLLHAFEKPRNYKSKGKRLVRRNFEKGSIYLEDFKNNPNNYKKYEE